MSKQPNHLRKSEPFSWSKLSKKINKEVKTKGNHRVELVNKRRDSSSSSEDDRQVSSRQKELLLKNSPHLFEKRELTDKIQSIHNNISEERGWLKSARQRELVRTRSDSNIPKLFKDQPSSALQKQWPSTAKRREKPDVQLLRGEWSGSAGSREFNDSSKDSAGSIKNYESKGSLLVEAVRFSRTRHIKILLDGGADPNTPDDEGVTPLIAAVADVEDSSLRQQSMQLLLKAGADPNVGDRDGNTPLMHAASNNCHEAAVTLLQHGKTDPGLQNNEGFSALMLAASRGISAIVLLILATFKKVHHVTYLGQRNGNGLTAYDLAQQNGHYDISNFVRVDVPIAPRPQGLVGFIPAAHDLSRSPTPSDSCSLSGQESSDESKEDFPKDQTFRPPTPVADFENLDSLSLGYNPDSNNFGFINEIELSSSSPGSGNEADIESLMDGDYVSVNESDSGDLTVETTPHSMSSPAVKSASSTVGISPPASSSLTPSDAPSQQVKILSPSGNLLVDRRAIEKLKDIGYSVQASATRKEGIAGTSLSPLIKISSGSPTKGMPIMVTDPMPKIGFSVSNKSLNKSIKNLVNDDLEMRPGNRPPTPARPSLPTLLGGKQDSSGEGSSLSTSSSETANRARRMTVAGFQRSTSEAKALSVPPSKKSSQDEETHRTDVFDVSTKSEGWDVLWGPRGGRSLMQHSEGHVVPLPPIGHSKTQVKSKETKKVGSCGEENVLSVAKKTLEQLETVLSHQYKPNRKSKSVSRSNESHSQLDLSS